MEHHLLQVKDLQIYFGNDHSQVKAVDKISFDLKDGETLGVVGESGSGKSVTALAIMQLLSQASLNQFNGSILWEGTNGNFLDLMLVGEQQVQKLRGNEISMIFQEPSSALNPSLSCGYQVNEILKYHLPEIGAAKKHILEWFERVQLPDVERIYNAYPHQISGGQLQRVMIVMAMITQPRLLIADEPTTALDVTVQKSILELLKSIKEESETSVIFISHDLGVIGEVADRVLVMQNGKILESGATDELFKSPQHPYTRALLACRPPLDKRYHRLPVIDDFLQLSEGEDYEPKEMTPDAVEGRLELILNESPILMVNELSTWFPKDRNLLGKPKSFVKAVDEISFEVYPGETLGIVGESGSGKTTLGRTIIGLERARNGIVKYGDQNLLTLSRKAWKPYRKRLQMIFQSSDTSLNPSLTIGQVIMEPMYVHQIGKSTEERRKLAMEFLERVGLDASFFHRYPRECSGGQRQRVAIARALVVEPELIICDESVSALDVSVQAQILNLLVDLREEFGLTYLFISHDLSVIRFISDRILVMNKGWIEEIGTSDEVFQQPKQDYTKELLAAIPRP